jgi:cell division protein FtsZ
MLENIVTIFKMKHSRFQQEIQHLNNMTRDDICFYRFIGGNASETEDLLQQLHIVREKKGLVLGIFRFPYRFEGKKRMQTAITQYFQMKELCDSVIFFHGDGMMDVIDPNTSLVDANKLFDSFEEEAIGALEEMICNPGEMNIDAHDVKTFIKENNGPLFLHSIEGDSFDEPLKYFLSAPYLPDNYTDGKQMIINIGYTKEVDMEAFRHINLRLNDMFHKADLVKLGTYFMDKSGARFKITLLVNGIDDPFSQPDDFKKVHTSPLWLKRKWSLFLRKSKGLKLFNTNEKNVHH